MWAKGKIESLNSVNSKEKIIETPLPQELSEPVIQVSKEKTAELKLSVEDQNNVDKLKDNKITYLKFLEFKREDRIKYCTQNNVDLKEIKSWKLKELTFDFKFGWKKINEKIYLGTTAGQLLPLEVSKVITNNTTYIRSGLYGEFFSNTGKRLTIHQWTSIKISKLFNERDIKVTQDINSKKVNTFLDTHSVYTKEKNGSNRILLTQIAEEAQRRNIDIDFAIKICMDKISLLNKPKNELENVRYISAQVENILTDFSRVRWTMYKWEYLHWWKESNKKYSDVFTVKLLERLYSWNALKTQAKKHWITSAWVDKIINREWTRIHNRESIFFKKGVRWLLDFIANAEWTHWNYNAVFNGANQSKIKYTQMTVREVIKLQYWYGRRKGSSAVWRYQVMRKSLQDKVKEWVVSMNEIYSESTQDKIAIAFLNQKWLQSFLGWRISRDVFQKRIAWTWRSLPKDASGKWVNQWDKMNNHATVSNASLDRILDNLKNS